MTRIYVAGPMSGLPELNFPAFHAEAARLRMLGHTVINPAEINSDISAQWADCMLADIDQLVTCDGISLLPGWDRSRGAKIEHHIATELHLVIHNGTAFAGSVVPPAMRRWADRMRGEIQHMVRCRALALGEDWPASRGDCLKRYIALELGLPIAYQEPFDKGVFALENVL